MALSMYAHRGARVSSSSLVISYQNRACFADLRDRYVNLDLGSNPLGFNTYLSVDYIPTKVSEEIRDACNKVYSYLLEAANSLGISGVSLAGGYNEGELYPSFDVDKITIEQFWYLARALQHVSDYRNTLVERLSIVDNLTYLSPSQKFWVLDLYRVYSGDSLNVSVGSAHTVLPTRCQSSNKEDQALMLASLITPKSFNDTTKQTIREYLTDKTGRVKQQDSFGESSIVGDEGRRGYYWQDLLTLEPLLKKEITNVNSI